MMDKYLKKVCNETAKKVSSLHNVVIHASFDGKEEADFLQGIRWLKKKKLKFSSNSK